MNCFMERVCNFEVLSMRNLIVLFGLAALVSIASGSAAVPLNQIKGPLNQIKVPLNQIKGPVHEIKGPVHEKKGPANQKKAPDGIKGVDFSSDIRPIFNKCVSCHGGVKKSGGFSVIDRQLFLAPTDSGTSAIVVGKAKDSELIRRLTSDDADERMPLDKPPLQPREIAKLREWIDAGAKWPGHWAYQPLPPQKRPQANRSSTGKPPTIDAIVRSRLAAQGIVPAPAADRRTLIRRLSLDLTGLLPTPEEVEAFVHDRSPNAYGKRVDQLLASPHFGERWARHWLDEARYADSEGYEKDTAKSDAFRFRDWVIRAINDDMPFDGFTVRQIAGDLLPNRTRDDLIATKFFLQSQFNLEGGVDSEEDRTKRVIDCVNTLGTVWLASTIGCCQCHDHPYDPFTQHDFYSLYAFFNNADLAADFLVDPPEQADSLRQERTKKWTALAELLRQQVNNKNLNNQTQSALSKLRNYDNSKGFIRFLHERSGNRRASYVFRRGNFMQPEVEKGALVPNTPKILPPLKPRGRVADRLDLARWLVDPKNPLTPRTTVNEVWLHLFGESLAPQAGDFGSRGGRPTYPRLLDWLASWFVHDARWSRKALIRRIVNSQTYRQASAVRPELLQVDPDNHLLARQNRFRDEAEILRDIALQVSGLLCEKIGGPSVFPPLPAIIAQQTYAGSNHYKASTGEDRYRRGLYTFFRRTAIDPNLSTFDCPDASASKPRRDRSNNALQALALLHNEVFHEAAQGFAQRLLSIEYDGENPDRFRLHKAFQIALGRPPEDAEFSLLERLLKTARRYYRRQPEQAARLAGNHQVEQTDAAEDAAWIATVRTILNLDEFVTRG